MAAELVSISYLHCVLKGLHRAPRESHWQVADLRFSNIDVLITPAGCCGPPHVACITNGIPIVVVMENVLAGECAPDINDEKPLLVVNSYLEAAGMIAAMRAGVSPKSLRRPLGFTKVHRR